MLEAFTARLAELAAQLDGTKAAHRKLDDDMGRVIDSVRGVQGGRVGAISSLSFFFLEGGEGGI